ncbi:MULTISPECIES: alpha/beta-type small acid-soluble spore protein [Bacillales]|uniref:Alpha/beta-type small acid-soluble spore protein n=1 Tax=Brevibacillus brevis (strain 47 / JCM 6285 / NBRC 100599) TaxID=358681 RepID=C0ZBI0_BREBN|nr:MULTISPECIES: alpha/beta-type small acid-soluble spore protein [Bacillales]KMZ41510.1 alpha/beta hydrolase [Bacillus sp. FJAT-27238]NQF12379.1 alpha/beta-type small acid-soluble spore protein [Brevibacillus sp. HB1.3]NRR05834.1 alpha/beta-type small acid-soluble spore protein [Brevibacillus sp. RS1.1]TQR37999.1 alpha/beta-type small acid-soluble spore protein [Lysinibacillus sp. SDF0063]UIO44562.1 alpha/beta-type small acid-soluble spore protein [Brevibacillus brevis]
MSRRKRPLVPEARKGLDALKAQVAHVADPAQAKFEVAEEIHVPLQPGYNGQLTSHDAGRIGGRLGGSMVKEMVRMAMEGMNKKP